MSKLKISQEKSPTHMSVNENDNSNSGEITQSINVKHIDGTPFVMIKSENNYWAAIGKWRISDTYKSEADLIEAITNPNWNMLIAVMHVVGMEAKEIKNLLTQEEINATKNN